MSAVETLEQKWAGIRSELESLPEGERTELARRILAEVGPYGVRKPGKSLRDLRGILVTDAPAPTDEEVARILEEERARKYGG